MPRAMNALEASLFMDRHPGLLDEKHLIDNGGMISAETGDLTFPYGDGRAIWDPTFQGYVLVWRDATAHWHFIDLSDKPQLAAQFNGAPYVSPDTSFTNSILAELQQAGQGLQASLTTGLILAVVVIVLSQRR
jgi:hypothetical protein